ncbi:MAG: choice-of-anchor B family protein [Chloroflexota bacterium]
MRSRLKLILFTSGIALLFLFLMVGSLAAHPQIKPDALSLPACTARSLSCQLPHGLITNELELSYTDSHCVDGLGVARSCQAPAPFRYINIVAVQPDKSTDGDSETKFLYIQRSAESAAECTNGMAGSFPCENVDLLYFWPIEEMEEGEGSDHWGWTDPETQREYVLMGRSDGVSFFDIMTPTQPIYLGNLPTHALETPWRDLKVYQNHLYVVSDINPDHGIQIFDLTKLRTITDTPTLFTETAHYDGMGRAHNIAIDEKSGFAYTVGGERCNTGLNMIDIQAPTSPRFAGCYGDSGYIHDTQCVRYHGPDLPYNDREICFSANADDKVNSGLNRLVIVDVTDKEAPVELAKVGDTQFHYFHQGWLTEDHRYFLTNDELDERRGEHNARTYIWDLADLQRPTLLGSFTSEQIGIDHNLYIRGSYAFEANYTSGLRILDLSTVDQGTLAEVAYLDTFPEDDLVRTDSAWSAYPFFQSGVVSISSIEGLFLTKPQLPPEYTLYANDNLLSVCEPEPTMVRFEDVTTIASYNDYFGTIQLSIDGPNQAAFYLENPIVSFAGNGEVSVSLRADLTMLSEGITELSLQAADGQQVRTISLWLDWSRAEPVAPELSQTIVTDPETLMVSWDNIPEATSYLLEASFDDAFEQIEQTIRTRHNRYILADSVERTEEIIWRVRALNGCSGTSDSATRPDNDVSTIYLPVATDE